MKYEDGVPLGVEEVLHDGTRVKNKCLGNRMFFINSRRRGAAVVLRAQSIFGDKYRNGIISRSRYWSFGKHVSRRFEVFTAVAMKNGVFWDATPCGSCNNRRFGGT
jgi:hypothetical protein